MYMYCVLRGALLVGHSQATMPHIQQLERHHICSGSGAQVLREKDRVSSGQMLGRRQPRAKWCQQRPQGIKPPCAVAADARGRLRGPSGVAERVVADRLALLCRQIGSAVAAACVVAAVSTGTA